MSNQSRTVTTETGLIVEYSPVKVDAILTPEDARRNGIETDKHRVQLRQTVTTRYPKARGNALFAAEDFGPTKDFDEKRVTWVNVPAGTTIAEVEARLNELPSPTLVRTLGLKPILTQSQVEAMQKGINTKTWEQYAENFVKTSTTQEAVKFQGRLQYRAIYFSDVYAEDNDNRLTDLRELQQAELEIAQSEANSPVQMANPSLESVANAVQAATN